MRTTARPRPGRAADRGAIAVTGVSTAVVVTTLAGADGVLRSADPGTDFDRATPAVVLVLGALLVGAILSCWVMLAVRSEAAAALALALALVAVGWWAGWTWLPDAVRAVAVSVPLLAAPALAAAVLRWPERAAPWARWSPTAVAATMAALLHAAVYDPFTDIVCLRTCVHTPTAAEALGVEDPSLLLGAATVLALAAVGLAVTTVLRAPGRTPMLVRCTTVAALAAIGLWSVLGGSVSVGGGGRLPLDLAVVGATAVPAIVAGASTARLLARRRSADLLIQQLQGTTRAAPEPSVVAREPGPRDLTPAQRLALTNARLDHQARAGLAETRAVQHQVILLADDERVRMERDLHDGAQQLLVTAALHVSVALSSAGPGDGRALIRARSAVMDALEELRRISHGPFPSVLTDEGLVAGIEELVAEHGGRLLVEGDVGILDRAADPGAVRTTYAVLGELLSSVPPGARVTLDGYGSALHVTVSSPGCPGVGLSVGTSDRLEASAGRLVNDGQGRVEVWVPCGS